LITRQYPGAVVKAFASLFLASLLASCDSGAGESISEEPGNLSNQSETPVELGAAIPTPANTWFKPALDSRWQWQLQGAINTSYDVEIYDIDLFDTPRQTMELLQARGKHVICYFSAGTFENWRTDASSFPAEVIGTPLPDFPAERWLDIRSDSVRQAIRSRISLAKQTGCDAVEPDNVDAYTYETGFPLTADDQLDYNRWLADVAHELGLGVGLKNDTDQVMQLVSSFDFAVTEQCFQYDECGRYLPFIIDGKPVFNTEYPAAPVDDVQSFAELCQESERLGLATLLMPSDLDDSFRIDCEDVVAPN